MGRAANGDGLATNTKERTQIKPYKALTLRGLAEVEEPAQEVRKRSQEGRMKTRQGGVQRPRNEKCSEKEGLVNCVRTTEKSHKKKVTWG